MQVSLNGSLLDTFFFSAIDDPVLADDDSYSGDVMVNASTINISLNYDNNGNPSSVGYLDFISIEAERSLTYVNGQFQFTNNNAPFLSGVGQYNLSNSSSISEIWDVSDQFNIPVKYIGVGEGIEDLQVFNKIEFVDSLFN